MSYLCGMKKKNQISKTITERRRELGMSKNQLSVKTGISYSQIINIENGNSTSTRLLDKLLDALGLELNITVKS